MWSFCMLSYPLTPFTRKAGTNTMKHFHSHNRSQKKRDTQKQNTHIHTYERTYKWWLTKDTKTQVVIPSGGTQQQQPKHMQLNCHPVPPDGVEKLSKEKTAIIYRQQKESVCKDRHQTTKNDVRKRFTKTNAHRFSCVSVGEICVTMHLTPGCQTDSWLWYPRSFQSFWSFSETQYPGRWTPGKNNFCSRNPFQRKQKEESFD